MQKYPCDLITLFFRSKRSNHFV